MSASTEKGRHYGSRSRDHAEGEHEQKPQAAAVEWPDRHGRPPQFRRRCAAIENGASQDPGSDQLRHRQPPTRHVRDMCAAWRFDHECSGPRLKAERNSSETPPNLDETTGGTRLDWAAGRSAGFRTTTAGADAKSDDGCGAAKLARSVPVLNVLAGNGGSTGECPLRPAQHDFGRAFTMGGRSPFQLTRGGDLHYNCLAGRRLTP